jgi:hypothetical protein
MEDSTVSAKFWRCASMTLVSAAVSAGYSVAGLGNNFSDNFARYAASRSIALLAAVIAATVFRRRSSLLALASCMTLVQWLDAFIGFSAHDPAKTFGPLAFSILNGFTAYSLWQERHIG